MDKYNKVFIFADDANIGNAILGRHFDRVDLIKPVSNVRPSIRVRPSTKRFFDFNEIWHAYIGRRVIHDGMQYDPIQGQGKGHEPFKVGNLAVFESCLFRHIQWELATVQLTTDS